MSGKTPNTFHYCFGMAEDFGGKPFSLIHYLSIVSTAKIQRPDAIYFHYAFEPAGIWWERARPYLKLNRITPPSNIFGVELIHPAHRADVVRLQVLLESGGIYVDSDVLSLRSFEPLRNHPCVLGEQGIDGSEGLCNAVILARRNARFLRRWLDGYDPKQSLWHGFRSKGWDPYWDEMSVKYPAFLAKLYPHELHTVGPRTFFWPNWRTADLKKLYEADGEPDPSSYCVHLWESQAFDKYLQDLNENTIRTRDTRFHRIARRFLGP